MALSDLLVALKDNAKLYVTLIDGENELISFNAAGYESVESDLGARTVEKIIVDSITFIKVYLTATP
jgi:hypothetical protein